MAESQNITFTLYYFIIYKTLISWARLQMIKCFYLASCDFSLGLKKLSVKIVLL